MNGNDGLVIAATVMFACVLALAALGIYMETRKP